MKIVNKATGESFEILPGMSRVKRLQRRVYTWASMLKKYTDDTKNYRVVMITLTYAPEQEWYAGQIKVFMGAMRKFLDYRLIAYAWVAELTQLGKVHYHVLLVVRRGSNVPMPDKSGLWPYGMSKIEDARSIFYITTYTSKKYQKIGKFPKGMRMFAVWIRNEVLSSIENWFFRMSAVPKWLYDIVAQVENLVLQFPKRVAGGGWQVGSLVFHSPYKFVFQ